MLHRSARRLLLSLLFVGCTGSSGGSDAGLGTSDAPAGGAPDGGSPADVATSPDQGGGDGASLDGVADTVEVGPDTADAGDSEVVADAAQDTAVDGGAETDAAAPCAPSLCDDGDPCTTDGCEGGVCVHLPMVCDDGDPCTDDACALGVCGASLAPSSEACCYEGVLLQAGFEGASTGGFFLADLASSASPAVTWQPHDGRARDGVWALYFGIPGEQTFDNGLPVKASATSKALTFPAGLPVELSFWAWLDVEEGRSWDVLTVAVIRGEDVVPVWAKSYGTPLREWFRVSVNLTAFANQTVQLMLVFDSVDATINDGEGVYIDDVRLLALCPAPPCATTADCDDSLACTAESCGGGSCVYGVSPACCASDVDCDDDDVCTIDYCDPVGGCAHVPVGNPLCCNGVADCDDGNPCTTDACTGGECKHSVAPTPGCCGSKAACNDGDPCTIDSCDAYQCFHVNTCCFSDAECDDGDTVCTVDSCIGGACVFAPTGAPGCCEAAPGAWTFDGGVEEWTFVNSAGLDKGFQVWTGSPKTKSPPGVLYYGDPLKANFDFGKSNGSATSPPVKLDAPGKVTVAFDLYVETEAGDFYDAVILWVVPDGGKAAQVWAKGSSTPQGTWTPVSVDLSAWAGKTVRLRFEMDTKDGAANGGFGVAIDNVAITNTCIATSCAQASECSDGHVATTDQCVAGVCQYVTQ
ncbi:MAG: hypothetical protein AMXMBFR64_21980 [Myxococcales bacterium]